MSIHQLYKRDSTPLQELLAQGGTAGSPATLLIPDLQRPYVWRPSGVVNLIDSLLRGWPFGTLLLWSFGWKPTDKVDMPHRRFWKEVDRTGLTDGAMVDGAALPMPTPARMVLDGQQRLQSLLLAVGGDDWGFKLWDRDWAELLGRPLPNTRGNKRLWSRGQLCLDVDAFLAARDVVVAAGGSIADIDYVPLLHWRMALPAHNHDGAAPGQYVRPLTPPSSSARHVRFSRLWSRAGDASNLPKTLAGLKNEIPGADDTTALHMFELVQRIATIRSGEVTFLEVIPRPQEMLEATYNEAIVNIFARLNTAGRALSTEEITFAWIKAEWPKARAVQATKAFESLRTELADEGLSLSIDELVQSTAAIWALVDRGADDPTRAGKLLSRADLMRGPTIRPMVADVAARWDAISEAFVWVATIVKERRLIYGTHFLSLNAVRVLWCVAMLLHAWQAQRAETSPLKSHEWDQCRGLLEKALHRTIDRWLIASTWSGRWDREDAFARCVEALAATWSTLAHETSYPKTAAALEGSLETLIKDDVKDATSWLDSRLEVDQRNRVRDYFTALWLWHRLDKDRWEWSDEMQGGYRRKGSRAQEVLHVDHIAPHAWCEQNLKAPDDEDPGNEVGNCMLLKSNFNLAKSARMAKEFLLNEEVWFQQHPGDLPTFAAALAIPAALLDPSASTAADVRKAIDDRTVVIRDELKAFVAGTRARVDV